VNGGVRILNVHASWLAQVLSGERYAGLNNGEQRGKMMEKSVNQKMAYSITEMAAALGIGRNKAHELAKEPGFPIISLGRRKVIPVKALGEWLDRKAGQNNAL
jgi:hypothetical protein